MALDSSWPLESRPNTVFMCSGQGSQKLGMGTSLLSVDEVAETFECASDVLGRDVVALVSAEGEDAAEQLNLTRNAQAAIAALSIGIGRALAARGAAPDALLGFSLGQISAISLAGMLSLEDTFRLINARGAVMDEAARATDGAMSALLKADAASVEKLCADCAEGDVLVPANYNSPKQIVISGNAAAVERAEAAWKEQGGRFSRLATQGAFHSPLMEEACAPFADFLSGLEFAEPAIPVICNTDASLLGAADIRERLVAHLTHPVRFQQSVEMLADAGARTFAEIGFGGVLSGLVKRTVQDVEHPCIQDMESFDAYLASFEGR